MSVDPSFAQWLKSASLTATASDAGVLAAWGDIAATSEIMTPLAELADAQDEAARQLAFLGGPLAIDRLQVDGLRADLIGLPLDLTADRAGYEGGLRVFVIGVEEMEGVARTNLTVLRRLT